MSQTTQFVSIPAVEGETSALIASTVWGVGGVQIEGDTIKFHAGPDLIGARDVRRKVLVQAARKPVPKGYHDAGQVHLNGKLVKVLVELPD